MSKIDIHGNFYHIGTMNVSMTNELEAFVESQIASGMYKSASEVVREALRQMSKRQEKITALERVLDERLQDPHRESLDASFWKNLRAVAEDSGAN